MAAEFPLTFPTAAATPRAFASQRIADKTLKASARFWFIVTIAGQLLFAFTVASYYGLTAARGDLGAWNRRMMHGHIAGDSAGNVVVGVHLASAVLIILAGAVQFVPRIRNRFPRFHRWTGRVYMLSAVTLTGAGMYMQWIRGSFGDESQRWGSAANAVVIWICAAMAMYYAIRRKITTHNRWALRLFLAVSAAWFFRAGLFLSFVLFKGPFGFDPSTFTGPFLTFMSYATFLFPLAVLELYFLAQARPGALRRFAMAAMLVVLTLATGAGVAAVSAMVWVPTLKAAFDSRKSLLTTLSATIETGGVDAAIKQYRALKVAAPVRYNFDENQLNTLGYQLLRQQKIKDAIRIFVLNTEAYPKSANTWDSLAEGYLGDGNQPLAIAYYRKSLQLDPNNANAAAVLRKLGTH